MEGWMVVDDAERWERMHPTSILAIARLSRLSSLVITDRAGRVLWRVG